MKLSQTRTAVNHEQITRLLSNLYLSIIINQLLGTILIIVVKDYKQTASLAVWYALLTASTFTRIFLSIKFKARQNKKSSFIPKAYKFQVVISGLIWGLAAWFLYPETYIPGQIIIALMVLGLIGTSAFALNLVWQDVINYNLALFIPFAVRYLYDFSYINSLLLLIVSIFSANIYFHAKKNHTRVKHNALLQNKVALLSSHQHKSEHELLSIFENSSQHLMLLSVEGQIVRANPKALSNVGLPLDVDLKNVYIWQQPWWDQDEHSQGAIHQAFTQLKNAEVAEIKLAVTSLKNNPDLYKICISPIYKNGQVEFLFIEGEGRSSIESTQTRGASTVANFHQLSTNIGECIWETDLNGYYQSVSKNSAEIKKIPADELMGKRPIDFMPTSYADQYSILAQQAIKSGQGFEIEVRTIVTDGSLIWEKIVAAPIINSKGEIIGIRGISTNISLEKNNQSMLIQSKEAAEAGTRAKSQFLANMSHEIRTPMNGVIGMAEILMDTNLDEYQKQYVNTIVASGHSLLQILNDILDLSKIEAGKLSLELKPLNLKKEVEQVCQLIHASFATRKVDLTIKIDEAVPVNILGDSTRIKQIFTNLVSNALKFTTEGYVKIFINLLQKNHDSANIEIKVVDSGIGISEPNLNKIFENFTQADDSTSRKYGGTGLGLSVTRELVQLMGGSIAVESKLHEGTTFIINLNLAIDPDPSLIFNEQNSPPTSSGKSAYILLVEDNQVNQEVALSMLNILGYQVQLATNGQEALDLCETTSYDLILMDCQMPVIDGYEATISIRASKGFNQHTPIVALTANAMSGDREKCLRIGMNDYLAKPVNKLTLSNCLKKYI